MAVEWELDEEENGEGGSPQTSTTSVIEDIGGAPAMATGQEQPAAGGGTASGSYTNLQKYIEANKGLDFGGQLGGKLESEAEQGIQQLGEKEGEFRSGVEQGTLSFDEGLKNKITQAPESLSEEEKGSAQKLRTGSYQGPTDFGGEASDDPYASLRQYFSGLEEKEKAASDTGSQKGLLKQYYGRPTYTSGEQDLDTLLLSGQRAPIEKGKGKLSEVIGKYGQKKEELRGVAEEGRRKSEAAKGEYRSLFGLDEGGSVKPYERGKAPEGLIQKGLSDLYAKEQARKDELAAIYKDPYSFKYRDPKSKEMLGVDRNELGIDPTSERYMTPVQDINYQRTASQQDLARMKALSDLAGVDQTYLDPNLVGQLDDEALVNFDRDKYLADILDRRGRFGVGNRHTTTVNPF